MSKIAIVTGITGQDGSYLAEHLLACDYKVVGVKRRSSTDNMGNVAHILNRLDIVEADMTDALSLQNVFRHTERKYGIIDEFYNLAAQSHVATSFTNPLITWQTNAEAVLVLLDIIYKYFPHVRFYQASTSEMFGKNYIDNVNGDYQNEQTPLRGESPYAIAKIAAHNAVGLYRDAHSIFGCCGILFNHESPRRGDNFVTQKVAKYVARLKHALDTGLDIPPPLKMGNLNASRDWGHAVDYVRAMHMMLQNDTPNDYIIATGITHTISHLCRVAFEICGLDYIDYVTVSDEHIRPSEVPFLRGDYSKARRVLGWEPTVDFRSLIYDMINYELWRLRNGKVCGY